MSNVKNKKMINQIALKSLKARKKRNLIAILAIALTSVLFTALFTIGGSLIEKIRNLQCGRSEAVLMQDINT